MPVNAAATVGSDATSSTQTPGEQASTEPTLRVVSVSLGSSSRNHSAQARLLGRDFSIERVGTDGDLKRAHQTIAELDGQVAAIGLGGIDLYVVAGKRRYQMRDAAKLAAAARVTPVVDGSGLKDTLERETVRYLQQSNLIDWRGARVLVVSAVDRFGMAEELVRAGARCTFGDLLFILGLPIALKTLHAVRRLGALILPIACRLPFKMLYPTGDKQNEIRSSPKYDRFFADAQIIAGDFLLIRRFLPERLNGQTILTNTVTSSDVELLRQRGAGRLITTTPEFEGRSFGTNVMEGVFAALGARTPDEYRQLLQQLNWQPRIIEF
jgi:hypothetical protein